MEAYWISASETNEDGEQVSATKVLNEIHDSMCFCGVGPERCDTLGIQETIIEAASALLATGEWHEDFEDGWIKVQSMTSRMAAQKKEEDGR